MGDAEHLVSLGLTPSECEQMKALCARLSHLRVVADDPLLYHNLKFLGNLKHPQLSPVQETILETIAKSGKQSLNCLPQRFAPAQRHFVRVRSCTYGDRKNI